MPGTEKSEALSVSPGKNNRSHNYYSGPAHTAQPGICKAKRPGSLPTGRAQPPAYVPPVAAWASQGVSLGSTLCAGVGSHVDSAHWLSYALGFCMEECAQMLCVHGRESPGREQGSIYLHLCT